MRKQSLPFAEMQKNLEYIEVLANVLTTEVTEKVDENAEKLSGETIATLPCCPDLKRPPLITNKRHSAAKLKNDV